LDELRSAPCTERLSETAFAGPAAG
jgi:hypothetical protein